jgi:hypothetical protein
MSLSAFCDSDYNGTEGCLSTTGWIVFFGHTPLSWVARLQRATARSTGESEFLSLSSVAQECVYLQMLVRSLRIPTSVFEIYSNDVSRHAVTEADQSNPIFHTACKIWSDSAVALHQAKKPDHWVVDKLRHIRTAYFFFKSYCRISKLSLHKVAGTDNPSGIYTKGWGSPGKTAANQKSEVFQRHALFCSGRRLYQSADKPIHGSSQSKLGHAAAASSLLGNGSSRP